MKETKGQMKDQIAWIEIPVEDFDRSVQFYEEVFQLSLQRMNLGDLQMAIFPDRRVALCCHAQFYHPGAQGAIVYFAADHDVSAMQERVTTSGGEVLIPWRMISPEQGSMALFKDSEGNRVGVRGKG
jgi:predicted enzyme related to lactoylglutathione lyase